jgi:hypothetical protein
MSLSSLLTDTTALLNDQNYSFTSKPQLTRWVNEARRNLAKRTGCIRRLITGQSAFGASAQPGFAIPGASQPGSLPDAFSQSGAGTVGGDFNADFNQDFSVGGIGPLTINGAVRNTLMTIPGVERYPYIGFFNPQLQAQHAGCQEVADTIACSVNWGGTVRPTLDWMPWDDLQAYARAYAVLNTSYPSVWSVYNDGPMGEIWMFPVPSQQGEIELDVTCLPKALYTDDDFDAIPDGFQEPLKFLAASLAFMASGRYMDAQVLENAFAERVGVARVAVDAGKTKSYYWQVP